MYTQRHTPLPPRFPNTKISATLLDFGEPLLTLLGDDAAPELWRPTMKIVITVWNAYVLAMPCWGQPSTLEQLKDSIYNGTELYQLKEGFEVLTRRRMEKFADDARAVGEWDFVPNRQGGYNFRCDARVPPGFEMG